MLRLKHFAMPQSKIVARNGYGPQRRKMPVTAIVLE